MLLSIFILKCFYMAFIWLLNMIIENPCASCKIWLYWFLFCQYWHMVTDQHEKSIQGAALAVSGCETVSCFALSHAVQLFKLSQSVRVGSAVMSLRPVSGSQAV